MKNKIKLCLGRGGLEIIYAYWVVVILNQMIPHVFCKHKLLYGKKERGSHLILKIDKDTFIFPCQFVFFIFSFCSNKNSNQSLDVCNVMKCILAFSKNNNLWLWRRYMFWQCNPKGFNIHGFDPIKIHQYPTHKKSCKDNDF